MLDILVDHAWFTEEIALYRCALLGTAEPCLALLSIVRGRFRQYKQVTMFTEERKSSTKQGTTIPSVNHVLLNI